MLSPKLASYKTRYQEDAMRAFPDLGNLTDALFMYVALSVV